MPFTRLNKIKKIVQYVYLKIAQTSRILFLFIRIILIIFAKLVSLKTAQLIVHKTVLSHDVKTIVQIPLQGVPWILLS